MNPYVQVVTTTADRADAEKLAREALERRVAACAQIDGPLTSVYRWKGEVETATEWRCTFKTPSALYEALEGMLRELHPYETPEIVVVEISGGARGYLDWIDENTTLAAVPPKASGR